MLLCSIADVRDRSSSDIEDDPLGALIESVSDGIEGWVGAWLAPRPAEPDLTTTYLFDVERQSGTLRLVRGDRHTGIRTLTALGIASVDQPESGGTHTAVTLADVLLRPRPTEEGPASMLVLTTGTFYRGFNTVTATGSFGPAAVSSRVREVTIELVSLSLNYNPGLVSQTIGSWSETFAGTSYTRERDAILSTLQPAIAV